MEDEEEDDSRNPYLNLPHGEDEEGDEEGDEDEDEDGDDYDENGDEFEGDGEEGEEGGAWQPDPTRLAHMQSAMMIQRAACLDLVGEKAFNEL